MCVGTEWCTKHAKYINGFAKNNEVHILTDNPSYFKNCKIYSYDRNKFSYYEKLNHIVNLSSKYKSRITYVDVDILPNINTEFSYNSSSLYTYDMYDLNDLRITKYFGETEKSKILEIFSNINLNKILKFYIDEKIISFPYLDSLTDVTKDISTLQPSFESLLGSVPMKESLERYSEVGIGYGEGWVLNAICLKYNIDVKSFDWRKKTII